MTDKCDKVLCPYRTENGYCKITACINKNLLESIATSHLSKVFEYDKNQLPIV